jgi:hypothetical protein
MTCSGAPTLPAVLLFATLGVTGCVLETEETVASQTAEARESRVLCWMGFRCRCSPDPSGTSAPIIDDEDGRLFSHGGPWHRAVSGGLDDSGYLWALPHHGANATWQLPLARAGRYDLRAWIPVADADARASYTVETCSGTTHIDDVSQRVADPGWIPLGEIQLEPGAEVRIWNAGGERMLADAVALEPMD